MTRTFEEMCKARDPLYAATKPHEYFELAVIADERLHIAAENGYLFQAESYRAVRSSALLLLAVKALKRD